MNLVEDKIVHLLTGKPNLGQVTVDELLAITDEQPFFSVAQLLLTQKMKQVNHPGFTHQLQKTALFFPNTFWLDQHLQAQPNAGYSEPASAPVNTYTPPPPAYTPAPAVTPSYTPAAVETPKPASFESNPYAPPGYTPPAEVGSTAPKQDQPWYNNPDFHKEPSFPAASTSAPEVPATPAAPAPSINDSYAAYLPQQDILSKVSGNTPPATPPPAATPPAYTPDAGYTPASSYTPGNSYTPESSYTPAPAATPESAYAPASSNTSGSSYTPASSYTPGASYTPDTSYTPASSGTQESAYAPASSSTSGSSYTPASSYTPGDSYNAGQSAPPAPESASEQSKTYEPWYTNPDYQQPAATPEPAAAAPSSVNDAYSAYLPQGFSAPAPATPAETPAPTQPSSYTPPSSIDDYAPPPTIDRYTPSEQSYAPASSYTPGDNSGYAPPPTMDRYAPSEPENRFTPPPVTPAPLPEPVAEQPKVYDPWYTNPIYQQPYQDQAESTTPAEPEITAPETEAALPAPAATTDSLATTTENESVAETQEELPAVTTLAPEAAASTTESIEVIVPQEEPVAPTAYPAPEEPVQEASPAVAPTATTAVDAEPAVSEIQQAESETTQPAADQPEYAAPTATPANAASEAEQYGASGPYRLSRPPVIEVTEETSVTKPEPINIVELAEAGSETQETPVAETPALSTDQDFAAAGIVEVTSSSTDNLPPLDDNTDMPEEFATGTGASSFSPSRLSEILSSSAASLKQPLDNSAKLPFGLEPYMIDYFASQGINLEEVLEAASDDTLGKKVRKFTDWLRQMRRINPHPNDLGTDPGKEQEVQGIAALSIEAREILTESMADVLVKQGKHDKAIQLYSKLSFLNPAKTAYFASKIIETSKLSGK